MYITQNWPNQVTLKNSPLKWQSPRNDEIEFVRDLFRRFFKPQMVQLEEWANRTSELSTSQIEKSLSILLCISGLRDVFPLLVDG